MPDSGGFIGKQLAFAAHIRDPENVPAPDGIEDRRMAIYRNLFFNNLNKLLSTTFPVVKKILGDERWRGLIREFMRRHRARTPYFPELPAEFVDFLAAEYEFPDDLPFLRDLAHYEYAELALSVSPEVDDPGATDADGDLVEGIPVRSALCRVYAYAYPVHRISPDYLPAEPLPEPVHIAVFRDERDKVRFAELNPLMARLLEAAAENPERLTGKEILQQIAAQIGYADTEAFLAHGREAFAALRANGMLIGARKS
jgi:hypothetical protein